MSQRRTLDSAYATTEDIMQAANVTRRTVTKWVTLGLLPKPTKVSHGYPLGAFNRYPASALSRARFIATKRLEGLRLDAILELLNSQDAAPPKGKAKAASTRRR